MGLHYEHLPASIVVHDFKQRTMSGANRAFDALGMGPSARYTLNSVITILCILTVSISMSYLHSVAFISDIHIHIYVVTHLLMFYFCIKLTIKIANYLTSTLLVCSTPINDWHARLPLLPIRFVVSYFLVILSSKVYTSSTRHRLDYRLLYWISPRCVSVTC